MNKGVAIFKTRSLSRQDLSSSSGGYKSYKGTAAVTATKWSSPFFIGSQRKFSDSLTVNSQSESIIVEPIIEFGTSSVNDLPAALLKFGEKALSMQEMIKDIQDVDDYEEDEAASVNQQLQQQLDGDPVVTPKGVDEESCYMRPNQ